jgi:hypothetical protein
MSCSASRERSLLGLVDQPGVLGGTGGEVREHAGPHEVPAVKAARANEVQGADLTPAHGERDDHPVLREPSLAGRVLRRGEEPSLAGAEEPFGLLATPLDDRVGLERNGDGRHRIHERLEEARLGLQLVLGVLVTAALRDDQVDGKGAGERGRDDEPARCKPVEAGRPADRARHGRGHRRSGESARGLSR